MFCTDSTAKWLLFTNMRGFEGLVLTSRLLFTHELYFAYPEVSLEVGMSVPSSTGFFLRQDLPLGISTHLQTSYDLEWTLHAVGLLKHLRYLV